MNLTFPTMNLPHFTALLLSTLYLLFLLFTIVRILLDTNSTPKTLAYLLLVIVVPLAGIVFYYSFGTNFRHKLSHTVSVAELKRLAKEFKGLVPDSTQELVKAHDRELGLHADLIHFIHESGDEKLSADQFHLLINGEEKFPEVLRTLATARHFIHMEYYDWENDIRGNQIKDVLIERAKAGVRVRVLYDAYASRKITHNIVAQLSSAGVEIHPVIRIRLVAFANRMNHRDHRKLIIMDGHTGFIGGLNISDRYDNSIDTGLWWRDTHIKIIGGTVHNMQRHFLVNWNVAQANKLSITKDLFPEIAEPEKEDRPQFAQIVAGGPIYPLSNIMLTYFKIFSGARKKLYITNPYFIPNGSIIDALKLAALSGVDVRLIMPARSDSFVVGAASKFYYAELLEAGVRIFLYEKGFVHAKTVVSDATLSVVGTANMDIRSFDLNFEIMAVIYGEAQAQQLEKAFLDDLRYCRELNTEEWLAQGMLDRLTYSTCRLVSAFL